MARHILIIDDDTDDLQLFCEAILELDASILCDCATSAPQALSMLKEKKVDIPALIFLDINMPRVSGWECLAELKGDGLFRDIPVIMYSTSSHRSNISRAKEQGALLFYTKPNNFEALKKFLAAVIAFINGNKSALADVLSNPDPV